MQIKVYLCPMFRTILLLVGFLVLFTGLNAQTEANPFELKFRLPKVISTPAGMIALPVNPFDVAPHRAPGVARALSKNDTKPFEKFSWISKGNSLSAGTLFWVLAIMFGLLTFTVALNRSVIGKAWRSFLNDSSLTLAQRESAGLAGSTPYYLLYLNYILQAGMFFFLLIRYFQNGAYNNLGFLLSCLFLSAFVFLSKHALLNLVSWLYPVKTNVVRYNFLVIVFNCILGLFLVPFNLLLAFSGEWQGLLAFWTLGLAAIFFAYRMMRSASIGAKFLADDQFHFLLYLCTVEIAPVMLLIKIAMLQTN